MCGGRWFGRRAAGVRERARITEVATGLNYLNEQGQWSPSVEEIAIVQWYALPRTKR
jgi:hypothetical protein